MSDINSFTDADVAIVFRHLVDSRQSHSNTVIESVLVAFQLNDKFRDTLVNTLRQAHLLSSNYQVNQIMDRLDALQN